MDSPNLIRENIDDDVVTQFFENNTFKLAFQKKVALNENREVVGFEAFLRLQQDEAEFINPGTILPVVARMGLLPELTQVVVTQATEGWKNLAEQGLDYKIAINIDTCVLEDTDAVSSIINLITQSDMPANRLSIDIVMEREGDISEKTLMGLNRLRMIGTNLALDINSIDQLNLNLSSDLPIDEIKLGRKVVCNIFDEKHCRTKIKAFLSSAKKMSLAVTAVGIETDEECQWLQQQGIDFGQGFLFGQGLTIDQMDASELLNDRRADHQEGVRLKLLVVEDDLEYGNLMMNILSEHYEFYLTDNESSALEIIKKERPEILLLDINLSQGNGFNIADTIRKEYGDDLFSIIFVSGDESPDNRIKAYEAGGLAFIPKPVPVVDLVTKISRYATIHRQRKEQSQRIKDSESMAFQSMREASHYGDIVQFMKEIPRTNEESGIANALFKYMGNRGLQCSIVFRNNDNVTSFNQNSAACSPTELNVFDLLKDNGRLYEFGQRLMINDRHISFLVKNMPECENDQGQVRDYTAVLIECMESRYLSLLQSRVLESVANDLSCLTQEASLSMEKSVAQKREMVDKFSLDISMSFHVLDLSIEQEEHLKQLIEEAVLENDDDEFTTDDIVNRIESSVTLLNAAIREVNGFHDTSSNDEPAEDAIELF